MIDVRCGTIGRLPARLRTFYDRSHLPYYQYHTGTRDGDDDDGGDDNDDNGDGDGSDDDDDDGDLTLLL